MTKSFLCGIINKAAEIRRLSSKKDVEKMGYSLDLGLFAGVSKENTLCLKGICAVMVLVHHIYQNTAAELGFASRILDDFGFLAVSFFFFISGFGLMSRYMQTNGEYVNGFVKNRIIPFYADYLMIAAVYALFCVFAHIRITARLALLTLTFGDTVVKYGWYVQVALLFYIVFYFSAAVFKSPGKVCAAGLVLVCAYFVACYAVKFGDWWYVSVKAVFAYPLGMFFALCGERIMRILDSRKRLTAAALMSLCLFLAVYGSYRIFPAAPEMVRFTLCSVVFPCTLILLTSLFDIRCAALRFLGGISYEIYVLQGLFLMLFHSDIIYIENSVLYIAASCVCILTFSVSVKFLIGKIRHAGAEHNMRCN